MKILLVEDNKSIIKGLEYAFAQNGYSCEYCLSLDEAVRKAPFNYDAAVLDIMLPDGNGFDLLKKIRRYSDLPVIFLTAVDDEDSVVNGLELGADDYITKPYNPMELVARVRSNLRRYMQLGAIDTANKTDIIEIGGLELDTKAKSLKVDGEPVKLTATELKILELLMKNAGRIFSAEEIYSKVWNEDAYAVENTVMVHIRHIREKIEINPREPKYLKVVWGIGYKIEKI